MNDAPPTPLPIVFGFERESVMTAIDRLIGMRPLRPDVKMSRKHRQIVTSIKAVGLIDHRW